MPRILFASKQKKHFPYSQSILNIRNEETLNDSVYGGTPPLVSTDTSELPKQLISYHTL